MARKTLQQQGVPIPSKLPTRRQAETPTARRRTVRDRTPLDGRMGGTRDTTTYYEYQSEDRGQKRSGNHSLRKLNPANVGANPGSGVGGLEAEFLLCIVLLFLLMLANSQASYGERVMSFMKRGTLACLLFFILALIASIGTNAARIAKGFGALVIIALLVTSPMNTVISDLDNIVKNDWVPGSQGVPTADNSTQAGSNSGTQSNTSNLPADFVKALEKEAALQGQKGAKNVGNVPKTAAENALVGTLNGIIPGSGTLVGKIFGFL